MTNLIVNQTETQNGDNVMIWKHFIVGRKTLWLRLDDKMSQTVRCVPCATGQGFIWQFRKVVSWSPTIKEAQGMVEAGAEYFEFFRRNPYS